MQGGWVKVAQVLDVVSPLNGQPTTQFATLHVSLESLITMEGQSLFLNGMLSMCSRAQIPLIYAQPKQGKFKRCSGLAITAYVGRAQQSQDCCDFTSIITVLCLVHCHCHSDFSPLTMSWPLQICHLSPENAHLIFFAYAGGKLCTRSQLHLCKSD